MNETFKMTAELQKFLDQAARLTKARAELLDVWNENTTVEGMHEALAAVKALLDQPIDGPGVFDSYADLWWDEFRDLIQFPEWEGDAMHNEWLYEGVFEIAERTQQAVLLQGQLTSAHVDALTAAWRAVVGPVGTERATA